MSDQSATTASAADDGDEADEGWLGPGVAGIGTASLLADAGHEIPTALLPSLLTSTMHAPAAALGLIEGISDGLAGVARLAGGGLADDPGRRRAVAVGGYTSTAVLAAAIGAATSVWQVGLLRAGAWTARGLRVPARNALLADAVPPSAYGRAYGFERMMDNLGAIVGPLLALGLVATVGVRWAIGLSVIPGLLAAGAIVYAIRKTRVPTAARTGAVPDSGPPCAIGAAGVTAGRGGRVRGGQRRGHAADPSSDRAARPSARSGRRHHYRDRAVRRLQRDGRVRVGASGPVVGSARRVGAGVGACARRGRVRGRLCGLCLRCDVHRDSRGAVRARRCRDRLRRDERTRCGGSVCADGPARLRIRAVGLHPGRRQSCRFRGCRVAVDCGVPDGRLCLSGGMDADRTCGGWRVHSVGSRPDDVCKPPWRIVGCSRSSWTP